MTELPFRCLLSRGTSLAPFFVAARDSRDAAQQEQVGNQHGATERHSESEGRSAPLWRADVEPWPGDRQRLSPGQGGRTNQSERPDGTGQRGAGPVGRPEREPWPRPIEGWAPAAAGPKPSGTRSSRPRQAVAEPSATAWCRLALPRHRSTGFSRSDYGDVIMSDEGTLHDAFIEELKDTYDAEKQLIKALPKLAKAATSPQLKQAFESHLAETQTQVPRLEKVFAPSASRSRGSTATASRASSRKASPSWKKNSTTPRWTPVSGGRPARRTLRDGGLRLADRLGADDGPR